MSFRPPPSRTSIVWLENFLLKNPLNKINEGDEPPRWFNVQNDLHGSWDFLIRSPWRQVAGSVTLRPQLRLFFQIPICQFWLPMIHKLKNKFCTQGTYNLEHYERSNQAIELGSSSLVPTDHTLGTYFKISWEEPYLEKIKRKKTPKEEEHISIPPAPGSHEGGDKNEWKINGPDKIKSGRGKMRKI